MNQYLSPEAYHAFHEKDSHVSRDSLASDDANAKNVCPMNAMLESNNDSSPVPPLMRSAKRKQWNAKCRGSRDPTSETLSLL
jgi:hypothetical protein